MRSGKSPTDVGKSPKAIPVSDAALDTVGRFVGEAVAARRHRGRKIAISEVARFLGFSERRVRAYVDREVKQALAWELLQIQQRQQAELEDRLRALDAEAAIVRARLDLAAQ